MKINSSVSEYIANANQSHIDILEEVRQLIHENASDVGEEIKWKMPVFGCPKDFAFLRSTKNHVTLGLYNSENLLDPNNLLEGVGKTMKHVKIKNLDEALRAQIVLWLQQINSKKNT